MENVYKKNYTKEFINKLPIKWDYWANVDLNKIPNEFHCLFTTDWNWGPDSSMSMDLRIIHHEIFLEYSNIKNKLQKTTIPILTEVELEKEQM